MNNTTVFFFLPTKDQLVLQARAQSFWGSTKSRNSTSLQDFYPSSQAQPLLPLLFRTLSVLVLPLIFFILISQENLTPLCLGIMSILRPPVDFLNKSHFPVPLSTKREKIVERHHCSLSYPQPIVADMKPLAQSL